MEGRDRMWLSIQFSLMATSLATLFVWLYNTLIRKRKVSLAEICLFFVIMFVLAATLHYFLTPLW